MLVQYFQLERYNRNFLHFKSFNIRFKRLTEKINQNSAKKIINKKIKKVIAVAKEILNFKAKLKKELFLKLILLVNNEVKEMCHLFLRPYFILKSLNF